MIGHEELRCRERCCLGGDEENLALSLVGMPRYTTATLLAIRTHEWKGSMDSTTHPVCIPAPWELMKHLWCCWCKIGSQYGPVWTCPRAPYGGDTLWLLVQLCLLPQLHPILKWEPHPSSYFLSQQLPGKLLPCSFLLLESLLGPLVCAFLEHFMVPVALDFHLFNSLFLSCHVLPVCLR